MDIRRYRSSDRRAVWELHNVALRQIRAHPGNGQWDRDLHRVEAEYLATGGEFYVGVMRALERSARSHGASVLIARTTIGQMAARRLDSGFGYREIGRSREGHIRGPDVREAFSALVEIVQLQ